MTGHAAPHQRELRNVARRAMVERSLLPEFSDAAIAEVTALAGAAGPGAGSSGTARDMRDRLWVSIDNDDSRDLDQLSVAETLPGGAVRLFVAIADVDALVKKGSALDAHAQANTTSVYTAAQVFPMLPEKLSTDLTSLGEGVDRFAVVVEIDVQPDGSVARSDVYRADVRNHAKLAYNGVGAWLDGTAPAPARVQAVPGVDEQLRIQDGVAQQLRKLRFERGALTLETLEARAVFDEGALADLVPEGRNRAKDLIEDLMIAANGVTARFLDASEFPSLRRVLRSPERWEKIVLLARSLGESLPADPSNEALEGFLMKRRQAAPERFADLSLSVVKLLGRGEYVLDLPGQRAVGHFGLALNDYTHSTAPNRRFPDLVTQRLLKAAMAGRAAAVRARRAPRARVALHGAGRQRDEGGAPCPQVGRGAALVAARRRAIRRASSPALRRKARGSGSPVPRPRDGSSVASRGSTSATASRSSSCTPTSNAASSTSREPESRARCRR